MEQIKALFTMNKQTSSNLNTQQTTYRRTIGTALIAGGMLTLLDFYLKTGWLGLLIAPLLGAALLVEGILSRSLRGIIPGCLLGGLGGGVLLGYGGLLNLAWQESLALLLAGFAAGWFGILVLTRLLLKRYAWWSMLVGGIIASLALCFAISDMRAVDFFGYLLAGTGIFLLLWGLFAHIFGLIIPGCILSGVGIGLYQAWGASADLNGLARTGIMLVIFALGWGMITVFSRPITEQFIWWPLIPGGVLAITGYGLYIGGAPNSALNFIGNTGSIGLILLGLYLLLMRRGIRGS